MSSPAIAQVSMKIPFFRPDVQEDEIDEVVATLRGGWLTTGPRAKEFEAAFAAAVGARYAVSVNSCTAALHLAVEAVGLRQGQAVLVPTMTFAASAEVVRYQGAIPILVDCDPETCNMDLADAERKLAAFTSSQAQSADPVAVVGIMPVHVGGLMLDMRDVEELAARHRLWVVEDAAHAFPAAWREDEHSPWRRCGENSAKATCFSFYVNKTITTGEGGMAVTDDPALADRIRLMSLHGLSQDAWQRYAGGPWDYRIIAPGYKYNLTDLAAAVGIHQLARAHIMRERREQIAGMYRGLLGGLPQLQLPTRDANRIHSWHLFPVRLNLDALRVSRNDVIDEMRRSGVTCSVHWRPLHLHPYYQETFGLSESSCPNATAAFARLISLPIFPSMSDHEVEYVAAALRGALERFSS
jgi:dTDP-4-amino-4,6-dideoxygalactose transaminase